MKKFYIIFILNLFLFQGFCQSTFELLIDNNHDEYPFEVIQTGHGDYFLVAASREDYTSSFYTQILHISQDGEILDTTELHNSDGDCIMYNLLQTGENSMVAVGERKHAGAASDLWYIGFDTSLLVQWEKTYEVDGDWIKFIRSFISQNGLIISGITHAWTSSPSYSRLLFQKISLTGDSIYGKYDDWGTNRICFDLLEMDTIYLVFTSGYSSYPGGEIVTLLQNFTIVSIDSIPHRFGNTLTAKNRDTSSYFLTGTFRLNSHNCIGIEHLTRTHQEISFSYTSDPDVDDYGGADQSMDIFSPDTLYTAGTMNIDAYNPYYSTNQSWYCLNNFDSSLNLRWTRHFGGDAYYVLRYILATYDGGALLSGTKYDAGQPDKKLDIYIVKVDSCGLITEIESELHSSQQRMIIYPNPVHETIHLFIPDFFHGHSSSLFNQGNVLLQVYNLFGQKILERNIKPDEKKVDLNVFGWPAGMYCFILWYKGQAMAMKKVVVQ